MRARVLLFGALLLASSCRGVDPGCPTSASLEQDQAHCVGRSTPNTEAGLSDPGGQSQQVRIYGALGLGAGAVTAAAAASDLVLSSREKKKRKRAGVEGSSSDQTGTDEWAP